MLSLDSVPRPNPTVVGRVLDQEAVLVLPDQRQVKVLNEVGARIWALADGSRSARIIAQTLTHEFAVAPPQAEADTLSFLAELQAKGVLQSE
jgi:hypothetical protein